MIETVRGYGYRFEGMKLKHQSIRFKFFSAASALSRWCLSAFWCCSIVFFYQDYYHDDTPKRAARCLWHGLHQLRE
ncbi:MAG: hypothetical protein ACLR4Z_03970 [Butyricicoccaceae bacterium]